METKSLPTAGSIQRYIYFCDNLDRFCFQTHAEQTWDTGRIAIPDGHGVHRFSYIKGKEGEPDSRCRCIGQPD